MLVRAILNDSCALRIQKCQNISQHQIQLPLAQQALIKCEKLNWRTAFEHAFQ